MFGHDKVPAYLLTYQLSIISLAYYNKGTTRFTHSLNVCCMFLCVQNMSTVSPSPTHTRHRRGNRVSDSEFNDWFDPDGRLVKEAAMREAIFHCEYTCRTLLIFTCVIGIGISRIRGKKVPARLANFSLANCYVHFPN